MKIGILVNDISLKGGLEIVTMHLKEEFQANNIQVQLFSLKNENDTNISNINMDIYHVNSEITKICQIITNCSITHLIVQLNNPFCPLAEIELYKNMILYNIKVFIVIHNSPLSFLKRYRNVLSDHNFIYILKIIKTIIVFKPIAKRFFYELNKLDVNFITLSRGNYNELKKYYGIESHVIYNIIPKYRNISLQNQINNNKKNQVVFVGRLDEIQKGLVFLLNSWNKVQKKNWKLLIVGTGDDSEKLKNYVLSKHINNICFIGYKCQDDIYEIISSSKILVLTSTHEGFPTVFYEALINNTVVICTKFDSFSDELIKNNINALVCKRKEKYFIKCLQRIIDEPQLLDFFLENNQIVLSNYKKIAVIEQWLKILS
jgi:glycosyltransferase involved in cell wall biosynthesis